MLTGKVALITGSTSGIGLGIARALAAQGCNLMLNGLGDPEAIERTRHTLANEFGVQVHYHGADLTQPDRIARMVETTVHDLGGLDILVNNAGIQHTAPVADFAIDRWNAVIAINLSAAFHTIRAGLPHLQARGWGRIINIASVHGVVASIHKAAYVAAKHGLIGLTKVVALETAGSGVTCNAICPGWVRTPLVEVQIAARAKALNVEADEAARHLLAEKQPSKQFVAVEDIGGLAVFLCSPAAAQITGASLTIDGGWTAQ